MKGGLRALYRTLELPGANPLKDAHAALDAAVLAAYGFSAKKDLLGQLLALNGAVAQRIEQGEPVTSPGIPANFPKPETLVSEDYIRPPIQSFQDLSDQTHSGGMRRRLHPVIQITMGWMNCHLHQFSATTSNSRLDSRNWRL